MLLAETNAVDTRNAVRTRTKVAQGKFEERLKIADRTNTRR